MKENKRNVQSFTGNSVSTVVWATIHRNKLKQYHQPFEENESGVFPTAVWREGKD